jgi:phosphoribosyl 1,2-cyclic phosphodiesterase
VSVGYVADTGVWTSAIADALADVDLLGVEFNHDIDLQRNSGRSYHLVERNLGPRGHLSNDQGAELIKEVLSRSTRGTLQHVVLLHLSQQCNLPELALESAREAIRSTSSRIIVHAGEQAVASPNIVVKPRRRKTQPRIQAELPF